MRRMVAKEAKIKYYILTIELLKACFIKKVVTKFSHKVYSFSYGDRLSKK